METPRPSGVKHQHTLVLRPNQLKPQPIARSKCQPRLVPLRRRCNSSSLGSRLASPCTMLSCSSRRQLWRLRKSWCVHEAYTHVIGGLLCTGTRDIVGGFVWECLKWCLEPLWYTGLAFVKSAFVKLGPFFRRLPQVAKPSECPEVFAGASATVAVAVAAAAAASSCVRRHSRLMQALSFALTFPGGRAGGRKEEARRQQEGPGPKRGPTQDAGERR